VLILLAAAIVWRYNQCYGCNDDDDSVEGFRGGRYYSAYSPYRNWTYSPFAPSNCIQTALGGVVCYPWSRWMPFY